MNRLTIFAKGNLDVRDSLHVMRSGDAIVWNGINEIVRTRFPGNLVRLRHELFTRSDGLLDVTGKIPDEVTQRRLPLDPYTPAMQFSTALFDTDADVAVLSIQPDATIRLLRHKREGYPLFVASFAGWRDEDRAWLKDSFDRLELLTPDESLRHFERIVARLRQRPRKAILVYNLSTVVPGESVHTHEGLGDIFSTRVKRFNLALIELSQRTGISVIDVDTVLARAGTDRHKLDTVHLTAEGCRLVAEEVVRVLDDLGCFAR